MFSAKTTKAKSVGQKSCGALYGLCAVTAGLLAANVATADHRPSMGAEVSVSSLGPGATLAFRLSPYVEARLGLNQASMSYELEVDGLDYSGNAELSTFGAILDVYPWRRRGLRLSIGSFINNNELSGTATPAGTIQFGDRSFQGSDIGVVNAGIKFPGSAPYAGIGWGRRAGEHGRFTFTLDAGVLVQGRGMVELQVENPSNLITENDIQSARQDIENELKDYELYPVISFGFGFAF